MHRRHPSDIKTSSLVNDSLIELKATIAALTELKANRDDNITLLQSRKSAIINLLDARKTELIKQLDDMKEILITDIASMQKRNENKINNQTKKLIKLQDTLSKSKEDLEFLLEYGSNTQIFLCVCKTINSVRAAEVETERLSSLTNEIDIEFQVGKNINKSLIGSVAEVRRPCTIKYKPKVQRQAQMETDATKSLPKFEAEKNDLRLKSGQTYMITGIAVTPDNDMLVSNYATNCPKVYLYRKCKKYAKETKLVSPPYGISVIPGTDRAVVTLPNKHSIRFINTNDLAIEDKVNIGIACYGVFADKDKIFVGGPGVVNILDMLGSCISSVNVKETFCNILSLYYDREHEHILNRYDNTLQCCSLDGTVVHQRSVPGSEGLTVDRHGNVYLSLLPKHEIQRLSHDGQVCDVVLKKCDGLNLPSHLSFNNDCSKLYVVSGKNNRIKIIQCK